MMISAPEGGGGTGQILQNTRHASAGLDKQHHRHDMRRATDVSHFVIRNPLALWSTSYISAGGHPRYFTVWE